MSDAFIGLYSILALMGTEGIVIGVLFAVGILYYKNRVTGESTSSNKKKTHLKAKKEQDFEVNSASSSMLDSLQLNSS